MRPTMLMCPVSHVVVVVAIKKYNIGKMFLATISEQR